MKVKELIAELQTCDPNAVIRCNGVLHFIEEKPYYYDGYAATFDANFNWVYEIKENKIDFVIYDISEYIMERLDYLQWKKYPLPTFEEFWNEYVIDQSDQIEWHKKIWQTDFEKILLEMKADVSQ
jgi:hypothetical protein